MDFLAILDFIFSLMDRCEEGDDSGQSQAKRDRRRVRRLSNWTNRDVTRMARRQLREQGYSRHKRRQLQGAAEQKIERHLQAMGPDDFQDVVRQWREQREEE